MQLNKHLTLSTCYSIMGNRALLSWFLILIFALAGCNKENIIYELKLVYDNEENQYYAIGIGNQTWMIQNLKVAHYNNGDPIPLVTDGSEWGSLNEGGICWYNNDETENRTTYGALYNYYVIDDPRGVCPDGFRIPDNDDWDELKEFLGGASVAGGKMKTPGTTIWQSPNSGADNSSRFGAVPGGERLDDGYFSHLTVLGNYWSATTAGGESSWFYSLSYDWPRIENNSIGNNYGLSIRCIAR